MDAKTALKFAEENEAKFLSIRFTDLVGAMHHLTFPINQLDEGSFEDGFGFDASSLRGWAAINESDMLHMPDASRVFMDPFAEEPTVCMFADVVDPMTRETYALDPRAVAIRAEKYLKQTKLADCAYFGPEAEFFVFDSAEFHNDPHHASFKIDTDEGTWNSGRESSPAAGPNLGYRIRAKEGYVPMPPADSLADMRSHISLLLADVGIEVECHHHEVATAQCEIDFRFDTLLKTADNLQIFKYVVRNTAHQYGKAATFMPKPLYGDNGSGMHVHQSLWKGEQPLFAGDGYAGISEMARHYIGGLLKHAPALVAFAAPTVNSYKRLVPGYEAPVSLAYSARNRSAAVRIPMFSNKPHAKRVEFRPPDPSCNPYLAFPAMLMAGLDGIQNKIEPGDPVERDIYDLTKEQLKEMRQLPGSLDAALDALEQDHEFLLRGDVFSRQLIERHIEYKRDEEIEPLRMRPHPMEFGMYFDV
ncbi:MAG: type I glutamate--ammonia ligase [Pyrinomonadaceae bacterium MAG19_C2-C3]|nr:type I glutamate--ammonia ligase [Pyrinomonadaceae bacterium MAG19_C2-C3]